MPLESVNLFDKKDNDDFQPTAEEVRVIKDKMKDPEFAKLMHEYMQSLSDPETRREEEEYLKQMEREAKEGGDYSFDFIFPKPGFVVELKETHGYRKNIGVYINVCESDRVEEFREETTGNRMGSNWHVPVAVSKERDEDFNGTKVCVFDAVFHPKTRMLADRSDRFLCFLVEIAVEHINAGYSKTFGFEFARQSSSLKSIGTPQNQTVRKQKGKSAFPMSDEPVSTAPIKPQLGNSAKPAVASASNSAKGTAANNNTNAAPPTPSSTTKLPKFTVLHEGSIDIQDAWQWKIVDTRVGVPQRLVVKMEFSGVPSAAHLDIEVAGPYIEIRKNEKCPYFGMIPLPFSVDEAPVSAKFDKSKQMLTLTLKVIPPTRPADMITADEMRAKERARCQAESDAAVVDGEVAQAEVPSAAAVATAPAVNVPAGNEGKVASPPKHVDPVPTASVESSQPPQVEPIASVPQTSSEATSEVAASSEVNKVESSHIAPDRASQLMAKLEEARKEREAAEQAEAAKQTQPLPTREEETPEVIDLRKKQDEWMSSMKKEQEERDRRRQEQEDEEQRLADEELRKQQREARKKLEMERDAERLEAALHQKMNELPLKSRFIFDID